MWEQSVRFRREQCALDNEWCKRNSKTPVRGIRVRRRYLKVGKGNVHTLDIPSEEQIEELDFPDFVGYGVPELMPCVMSASDDWLVLGYWKALRLGILERLSFKTS